MNILARAKIQNDLQRHHHVFLYKSKYFIKSSFVFIRCEDHIKMSLIKTKLIEANYPEIWRVFISGSSSAGKTYFAKQLLASKLFDVKRIYYFQPPILRRL